MEMFDQANQFHLEGKFQEAEELYDQLLTQNHNNAGLLATMGTLYLGWGKYGLAISLLERSLERSQGRRASDVLSNLGLAYKKAGLTEKAENCLAEACADTHDPSPEAMANYGALFIESDKREKGRKLFETALSLKPELALAHWNHALILMADGNGIRRGMNTNGASRRSLASNGHTERFRNGTARPVKPSSSTESRA